MLHHPTNHPIILGALLSFLALASLFSINSCGDKPEPLKLGVIAPLTGPAGHLADLVDGMKLAVGEINAWAGKEGRKIELIIEDSKSSAEAGEKAFERIEKQHRPHFYISATSRVSMALAPRAEERKVVLLGLATAAGRLTRNRNWVFKYYTSARDEAMVIAGVLERRGLEKVGILYQDDEFGRSIYNAMQQLHTGRGKSLDGAPFPAKAKDPELKQHVHPLLGHEAVYVVGYMSSCARALKTLRALDFKGALLATSGAAALPKKRLMEGVFFPAPAIYNPNYEMVKLTREKYIRRYNKDFNHYAANGYDAIRLMAGLLENEVLSRENVKNVLESDFIYPGIFGEIKQQKGRREIPLPLHSARIIDGRIIFLD